MLKTCICFFFFCFVQFYKCNNMYNVEYKALLLRQEWRDKRMKILARDNYRCVICGEARRELLEVHHRQYHFLKRFGMKALPWDYRNKYLVTLCQKCHQEGERRFGKVPTKEVY